MENISGKLLVSDEIYNKLLEKIMAGYWSAGERLPSEKQLCEMFSASRVSVRAALQRLQANGLILTRQGLGSIIQEPHNDVKLLPFTQSDMSQQSFEEFAEFRAMLEFKAVDLIAARHDPAALQQIWQALLDFEKYGPLSQKDLDFYDYQFHMTAIANCGNEFIIQAMNTFKDAFYHYVEEVHHLAPQPYSYLASSHRAMVEALEQRRSDVWKKLILEDMVVYQKLCFKGSREHAGETAK